MSGWLNRDFTVAEAAELAGVRRANIDLIVHRSREIIVLFSERRRGRRWFSPKDIVVLRVGFELERAGRNWLTAIAMAYQHLQHPPPTDAILVVPALSVSATSGRVVAAADIEAPLDKSKILVPIGTIAADIAARCADLKEATHVAV